MPPPWLTSSTAASSRQDIQDRLDKLQAELGFSGSGTTLRIAMSTKGENLPELTTLALDIVRNANFPKDQLEEYQRQLETSIRNAMTEPSALASRALARQDNPWPADDLRYVPTFDEALASARGLNRDALAKFTPGSTAPATSSTRPWATSSPKPSRRPSRPAWPAGNARPPMSAWQIRTARSPRSFDIETPDKANAFYLSRMPLKLQDSDADYAALYLANYLFGASETSRLWNRVRETEGLSYNVRSSLSVSAFEPNASWSIYAIYAPQNRERLEKAVGEELARVLDGFSDKEISDGITALLNYRNLARAQDDVVAGVWLDYLERGRTFAWSADMDKKISALTPDVVNAAMRNICARTPSAPPSPATSRRKRRPDAQQGRPRPPRRCPSSPCLGRGFSGAPP